MPNGLARTDRFQGLSLAQDRRQRREPGVVAGENFTIDAEGVKSDFGNYLVSEETFTNPQNVVSFRVSSDTFYCGQGVILAYDTTSQRLYPLFQFNDTGEDYPWSHAQVGAQHFFAKKGVGLIVYTPASLQWKVMTGGAVPAGVHGITQSGGRLVIQSLALITNSAQDDGEDLTTSTSTGAGFFALSLIGTGTPLGVHETDQGWIAFTTTGAMTGTIVDAAPPFRVLPLRKTDVPINPFCIIHIAEGKVVYLSLTGFWLTDGTAPTEWQPLQSEYYVQKVFPTVDLVNFPTIIHMFYHMATRQVFVSLSTEESPYLYRSAQVLYTPLDQWGSFDRSHYGFAEFYISTGANSGWNFGFVCAGGLMHRFVDSPVHEKPGRAVAPSAYYFRIQIEIPPQISSTETVFATLGSVSTFDLSAYPQISNLYVAEDGTRHSSPDVIAIPVVTTDDAGYTLGEDYNAGSGSEDYDAGTGGEDYNIGALSFVTFRSSGGLSAAIVPITFSPLTRNLTAIDAYVHLGAYRFTDEQFPDRLSQITNLSLGTAEQAGVVEYIDYMTEPDATIDWLTSTAPDEDWGSDFPSSNDFVTYVNGTLDGINTFGTNRALAIQETIDEQVIFYSLTVDGIYNIVEISAQDVNQSFHIKTAEVSGFLAGRL